MTQGIDTSSMFLVYSPRHIMTIFCMVMEDDVAFLRKTYICYTLARRLNNTHIIVRSAKSTMLHTEWTRFSFWNRNQFMPAWFEQKMNSENASMIWTKKELGEWSLIVFNQYDKPHCGKNSKMVFTPSKTKFIASPVRGSDLCPRSTLKLRCRSQIFIFLSPVLLVGN